MNGAAQPVILEGPLLEIENLEVDYATDHGTVRALRGVGLRVGIGESLAILGESGSGKSVTARAILGLIDRPLGYVRGAIRYLGRDLVGMSEREIRRLRGTEIAMVFQDSLDSLNPVYSVGSQLAEIFRVHDGVSWAQGMKKAVAMMEAVGIPSAGERVHDYPHQFSGGMRQRICIAMAVALRPRLLIADEPTTALDVTVEAGILRLMQRLQHESGMSLIFITHDLSVARRIASVVAVMYAGKVVEYGPIDDIFHRPAHPYTQALLQSHPAAVSSWRDLKPIAGAPPEKIRDIAGCAFEDRCPYRQERCREVAPALAAFGATRAVRCHFPLAE